MASLPEVKKVSVVEIGEKLRRAREGKGLSLGDAQKYTRIHLPILSALEDGRCDELLAPNYVKSFLKKYSNYLGLDHQVIVAEYLILHPELKGKNINSGINKTDMKASADLAKTIRITRTVIIFLALIFLAVFAGSRAVSFFKGIKSNGKNKVSASGKNITRANRSSSKAPAARPNTTVKNAPFTMTLRVKNPVMVQLKKDGVLIFKRVLPKATEETFAVNNSVNIFAGRAESIEIIINGKSFGAPGRGVIRNIEVTSNGVRVK